MLICVCNRISDRQIKSALNEQPLGSVRELRKHFSYPEGCCGKCNPALREMLNSHCQAGDAGCEGRAACQKQADESAITSLAGVEFPGNKG